jgi:hypothetical protein
VGRRRNWDDPHEGLPDVGAGLRQCCPTKRFFIQALPPGISKTIVAGEALSALNSVGKWAVFDPAKFESGCPRRVRSDAKRTL